MPAPGSLLASRYRLESRIAAGTMGEVCGPRIWCWAGRWR
jgi:hypothetical protein